MGEAAAEITTAVPDSEQESGLVPKDKQREDEAATAKPPRPKKNWRRLLPAPVVALAVALIGGAAVATQGGEDSKNDPAPIAGPAAKGHIEQTPDQAAARVIEDKNAEDQKPEMSEDEKRQRITEILQAEYPQLLPFLENGPLPYYEEVAIIDDLAEKVRSPIGVFRFISFVPEDAMGGVKNINKRLSEATNEHFVRAGEQGLDISNFPKAEGSSVADPEISENILNKLRKLNDRLVIMVPEKIRGEDTPWPWPEDMYRNMEPIFTAETAFPIIEGARGTVKLMLHPSKFDLTSVSPWGHHLGKSLNGRE